MKNLHWPVAAAVLATGCSSLSPTEDPAALRITDLEARLLRIERVVENQSLVQLAGELERLRADTAAIRGELETLRFETENSDSRQRELYVDVDRRLQTLETQRASTAPPPAAAPSFAAPSEPPPAVAARPAGSDQQNYQAAFDMISARRYAEAATAFRTFLTQFPTSPLADNAQYWLAETYYVRGDFAEALPEFRKVIEQYPRAAKMPDALLKVGYCQDELGDDAAARSTLQELMRQYPDTTAARLASQRLGSLSR